MAELQKRGEKGLHYLEAWRLSILPPGLTMSLDSLLVNDFLLCATPKDDGDPGPVIAAPSAPVGVT